jgi:thioredoxin reductase/Pyruvate/2-oxoacid:ferredoxin oxidoreductase delta subunit
LLETLIYVVVGLFTVGFPVLYIIRERRSSAAASATLQKSIERGLDEPVSLHPIIDPDTCISTGACVKACPETKVIGLIHGKAALISPSRCIGHGLCADACPVQAISLVFGTAKRGVDIPNISGEFESNVAGIFIAGELGGMGLIRNAVNQGRQAALAITKSLGNQRGVSGVYDLIIIGAGPAGIAASLQATADRLSFLTIDQDDLGGTILTYPRRKLVMSQPMELPVHGMVNVREISKEALLEIFTKICQTVGLVVRGSEKVEDVKREGSHFKVTTSKGVYDTQRILLAIGRRGSPRKLGVPGEVAGKVAYRLLDPEKYHDLKILVVGGGDSAVEAAVALSEQKGNTVHISYRREQFFRIKEGNQQRIDAAIGAGRVQPVFNSEVKEITPEKVILEVGGAKSELPNDQIFVFAGGELPADFLSRVGIEFTRKFGSK